MISHPFVILFFLLIICSLPIVSSLDILQKVMAQTNTTTTAPISSAEGAKVLVDDTIQALKNKDINKAVVHLDILNQQLAALGNLSSVQSVKVLLDDANEALKNGDTNKALVHLNLINQELAAPSGRNAISSNAALGSAISPTVSSHPLGKAVTAEPPGGTKITNNTYNLIIGGKAYPLTYQITGVGNKVNNITLKVDNTIPFTFENTTLLLNMVAQSNGKLTIELPRNLIDSKLGKADEYYLVWKDGPYNIANTDEINIKNNSQVRTLVIDFKNSWYLHFSYLYRYYSSNTQ